MTQFLRDQASDTEENVTPLMQDGTYLSRNFATLGPLTLETPCVSLLILDECLSHFMKRKRREFLTVDLQMTAVSLATEKKIRRVVSLDLRIVNSSNDGFLC